MSGTPTRRRLTAERSALRQLPRNFVVAKGKHAPDSQMCVMEAVAYVAREPWSDHPKCASRVITAFLISWNDAMDDEDRQILRPLIPKLVDTAGTPAQEQARSRMALDWLCRVSAPAA